MRARILALILAAAAPAAAEPAPILADPLMRAIASRQLTAPGGGITGAVRIGSGQAIAITLSDPLAPLKPAAGLVEKRDRTHAPHRSLRPDAQLRKLSEARGRANWAGRREPR